MFPYLKTIHEFVDDCESVVYCQELEQDIPVVVAQLIESVDTANWGKNRAKGVGTIDQSEIKSWCNSVAVYLYKVLEPLKNENLIVGLEYYLENRVGVKENAKPHSRVDVMIGGYGVDDKGNPVKTILVIESKQYDNVKWSDDGGCVCHGSWTQESPNIQVRSYCESLEGSACFDSERLKIVPCVFMHNLSVNNEGDFDEFLKYDESGIITDSRVTFHKEPVRIFIKSTDCKDEYSAFRKFILSLFDHKEKDLKALEVFKTLKKSNRVLTPEEMADMLLCDDYEQYIELLRPNQYFTLFGYGSNNRYWDNYLKNHIDYLNFFKLVGNRDFWERAGSNGGIIDIVEGGPGSGKSVLAMLLLRYCIDRKLRVAYLYAASTQVNKIFGILRDELRCELRDLNLDTHDEAKTLQELVGLADLKKHSKFAGFKAADGKAMFNIMQFGKDPEDGSDYDVYIIDDIHSLRRNSARSNVEWLEDLRKKGKLVIVFYDRHQLIESTDRAGETDLELNGFIKNIVDRPNEKDLVREYNSFRLWSSFRCNRDEGYLTWIERILGLDEGDPDEVGLFDFDVKPVDCYLVREIADRICAGEEIPVLTESEKECDIEVLLGHRAVRYKGPNGKMAVVNENGDINLIGTHKIKGIETDKVLVIIGDEIRYENGTVTGDPVLKKKYRVLLTRGLKECYIYVMDKALRDYMLESLEKVN